MEKIKVDRWRVSGKKETDNTEKCTVRFEEVRDKMRDKHEQ